MGHEIERRGRYLMVLRCPVVILLRKDGEKNNAETMRRTYQIIK